MINIVGISGASGSIYVASIIRAFSRMEGETYLIASPTAIRIYNEEMHTSISSVNEIVEHVFKQWNIKNSPHTFHPRDFYDIGSDIASGTNQWESMIILPASMRTVASISAGTTGNLIERVADVTLKERRKLIVVPREAPFNRIHLRNLMQIDEAGGIILPASPGFYQNPQSLDDLADFITAKIFNLIGIKHSLIPKWQG